MYLIHPIQMIDLDTAPPPIHRQSLSSGSRWAGLAVAGLLVAGLAAGMSARGTEAVAESISTPATSSESHSAPSAAGYLPVTSDGLEGIWFAGGDRLTGTPALLARFDADGTVTLGGGSSDDSLVVGTYQVRPTGVTISPTGGECEATENIAWHTSILAEGRLDVVHLGSTGDLRQEVGECALQVGHSWRFTRVSPESAGASEVLGGYRTPAGAVTQPVTARGYWFSSDTGTVVSIDDAGRYAMYAAADVIDTGVVDIDSTSARFISDGADECAPSVAMTWQQIRIEDGNLRGTVTRGACTGGLSGDVSLMLLDTDEARDALLPTDSGAVVA